jgi:hypothetical protein
MNKIFKSLVIVVLLLGFAEDMVAQKARKKRRRKVPKALPTMLCGTVRWLAGDQMPSPDRPAGSTNGSPVQRRMCLYELVQIDKNTTAEVFFKPTTRLVATTVSDKNGNFCFKDLKVGTYSLFSEEEGKGLFANLFDDSMNVYPVNVSKGQTTTVDFKINYAAAY